MRTSPQTPIRKGFPVTRNTTNDHARFPTQGLAHHTFRTSVTCPASAAATTIAGLISNVRPVGEPCRPLKLRFEDDAQISRPTSLSGFMARHIEQPASRHWKPASVKILSRPSRSAWARTCCEPGTTSALTPGATFLPFAMRAASRSGVSQSHCKLSQCWHSHRNQESSGLNRRSVVTSAESPVSPKLRCHKG